MWSCGHVVMWSCGHVVMWSCGVVGQWSCGHVLMWSCGHVVMWSCGHVVIWSCGHVVMWSCHHIILFFYTFSQDLIHRKALMPTSQTASTRGVSPAGGQTPLGATYATEERHLSKSCGDIMTRFVVSPHDFETGLQ